MVGPGGGCLAPIEKGTQMSQLLLAKKFGLLANPTFGNIGDWQGRHNAAVSAPCAGTERALVSMLTGWLEYAAFHQDCWGDLIGNDGVLGEEWAAAGKAIHGLLNGSSGRLDCGTLSTVIHDTMMAQGVKEEW